MPLDKTPPFIFGEHELRSVRESVATLVKSIPIDVTLSTTDVAEDLINITSALSPAYNSITNPSMELGTPPTGWVAVSSTLSRVGSGTVAPRTGSFSLQSVNSNLVANEGAYFEVVDLPVGWYALSCYVRNVGGGTVQIRSSADGGVTFQQTSAAITLDDTWQRISVKHQITGSPKSLRLYVVTDVQQVLTWFIEDAQLEPLWGVIIGTQTGREDYPPQAVVSDFVDPAGDRFSRFLGVANASPSIREPGISEIHEIHLVVDGVGDVYIDFDRTATVSSPASLLLREGESMNGRKIVKTNISFINATNPETPRVHGWVLGI